MSEHIEWSELKDFRPSLHIPGSFVDGHGNQNDEPALGLYSAVVEGPIEDWPAWALELFDEARAYEDADVPTIQALVDEAKAALTRYGVDELERTLRALVEALDITGKEG